MISFLFRKLWKCKWLIFCLMIGNILLVGVVSATPMYNRATLTRILRQDMNERKAAQNAYPALVQVRYEFNRVDEPYRIDAYRANRDHWLQVMQQELNMPALMTLRTDTLSTWAFAPAEARENNPRQRRLNLTGVWGSSDWIRLTYGRMPAAYRADGNVIEVIATEMAMFNHNLLTDELLLVSNVYENDPYRQIYLRIVGIYELTDEAQAIWSTLGLNHANLLLINEQLVSNEFIPYYTFDYRAIVLWTYVLDHNSMATGQMPYLAGALRVQHERFGIFFSDNFYDYIQAHLQHTDQLSMTLMILQLPLFIMLALYIYMVSRQILQLEQNDISILKSRGASRFQVLGLYVMQGLIVGLVSFPIGLALGVGICRFLGSANGFLELVQRTALYIEITGEVKLFAGMALLFSFATMLVPVIRFSKTTIVSHKLSKYGKPQKPVWQRFGWDFLALGASIYAIYNFNTGQIFVSDAPVDPLLLLGSSLFVVGLGLLCLRIFPYIIKLLYLLGQRFWPPSAYATLIKVVRSAGEEQYIMIFLIFTLAIGIFSAQAARTLNLNYDHQIRYLTGADLVFQERWLDNTFLNEVGTRVLFPDATEHVYREPSFERFTNFEEVDALTRVLRRPVSIAIRGTVLNTQLMGIETQSFGETVWFRDDLLRVHLNNYLNVLAIHPDGLLLSSNFRNYGFSLGDRIPIAHDYPFRHRTNTPMTIVGFVEHWPAFAPVANVDEEQFLAVANFSFLQSRWGILPYQVWMRTNTENNRFFREFQEENRLVLTHFADTHAQLVEMRASPMIQGTNGVLTLNFLITLFICFSGFLIYWILSIRSRMLQFGIFRAMGMGMGGIIRLLISEQLAITLTALGIGVIVGELAARYFVPLILQLQVVGRTLFIF